MTPLRQMGEARRANDLKTFAKLARKHPECLHNDEGWERWLNNVAGDGQLPFVKFLVEEMGIDVNALSGSFPDDTALVRAADEGRVEVTRWLLDRGATVNFTIDGRVRCAALTGAVVCGHLDMVKLLVERGADVNATGGHTTPLGYAVGFTKPDIADYLRSVGGKLPHEL
jgi:ankyrin repeat protein